ncbi:Wd repeat-containing protein [Thalictrum thalictroides]|uniref:Wd repeat-containing protein n=1 Tax=Thalictrum thalictroides TaxID=46969 RepID=A0A7J6VZ15_THATH|nr:Wd repeat-containing protein [Thalictrum thalictroides]
MAESRRMMMMNWDGLEDDDEFFESRDRISSVVAIDIASSGSDDDEDYDDNRISFASAISTSPEEFRNFPVSASASSEDYNIWMAEPGSIKDRRQRLLQGMGLSHDKELLRVPSQEFKRVASVKVSIPEDPKQETLSPLHLPSPSPRKFIPRSKSEGSIVSGFSDTKCRKETLVGADSKLRLLRLSSLPSSQSNRNMQLRVSTIKPSRTKSRAKSMNSRTLSINNSGGGGGFLIKNLDTGNVFLINEDGTTSSLSDLQTGKQLTMEEFEKTVGHSPIVKELMRRENVATVPADVHGESERKTIMSASLSTKSFRASKKKGSGWLKNIKVVANSINGFIADREKDTLMHQQPNTTSKWTKVHQHGKSQKEISGLYMCQEIQAHEGSIWCIKFSPDARYLASAGEDRIIHLWEVIDCDVFSAKAIDESISPPVHPMANSSADRPPLADAPVFPSERKRRGKLSSASKKSRGVPDFVNVPDTVFSLSDKPVGSFEGHLDDVLDLSWSKSQQLLSSSMDKTVRLWDMASKTCLKLFAHNDYVTCIQFNPMDDEYFISGSLDAKVRIWSIPDRKVVDWTDLHEMVTAVCYTPDGQGALVGSHRGSCRLYDTTDCKLNQKGQIDVQNKKKSQAKKITGFQFAPGNPSEVLITSADSRIRIFDGSDITYKFRGFRNTSSQISASFSTDGKYVVSASEDSQVYVWKRDEIQHASGGKTKGLITTQSYERFQCRDVSVAIPWPGSTKYEPSMLSTQSKNHSKLTNVHPSQSSGPPCTLQESFLRSPSVTRSQEALLRNLSGTKDQETFLRRPSVTRIEEAFTRSPSVTRNLPPLPKKNNISDKPAIYSEEEPSCISRTNSGIGDGAFVSAPASAASSFRECASISTSERSYSSLSWLFDGGYNSSRNNIQPTAWGLVVVTAGLGGELRIYQNFGLPVRVGRQTNLFASGSVGSTANKRFL